MRRPVRLWFVFLLFAAAGSAAQEARRPRTPAPAPPPRSAPAPPTEAHEFDFLLGAWDIDIASKDPNLPPKMRGRWTAKRGGDGFLIEDEYRVFDDSGGTAYLGETFRAYDVAAKRWEFRFVEPFTGKWHEGTGHREGNEMHLEQRGPSSILRIRYYNIGSDRFSWVGDMSFDGGKTWLEATLRIEARRASAQ
jgi:hypothetical protein